MVAAGNPWPVYSIAICNHRNMQSPGALANYMPVAARERRFLIVSALERRVSGHRRPSDLLRAFFALRHAGGNRKAASD